MGHDGRVTPARPSLSLVPLRGVLVALTVVAVALLGALPATARVAHAALVSSSPSDGSTLTAVPPEVSLTFNEDINPQFATVTVTSGGTTASTGSPEVDGATVYQPLDPAMAEGKYTVTYRVTSADGHPVSGKVGFTYDAPGGGEGADETSATSSGGSSSSSTSSTSGTRGSTSSSTTSDPSSTSSSSSSSDSSTSSSTTADPSSTSTTSTDPSSTSTSTTDPGTSPTTSGATGSTEDDGRPWWLWALIALGAAAVIGLLVALARPRRDRYDEDIDLARHHEDEPR